MVDNSQKIELHIEVKQEGETAVNLLAKNSEFSKNHIKDVMQKGAVWLTRKNGTERIRRSKRQLSQGDTLHLYYNKKILEQTVPAAELIYDGESYSVWNKPRGMLSQGSKWGDHTTIYRWSEQHLTPQRPAFIVHRLDRAAHGLILLAHTKKMAAALSLLFQNREVEKRYIATVHGIFNPEKKMTIDHPIDEKSAVSHIRVLSEDVVRERSAVEVSIETGRKHQIRKHLAESGHPIIGDRLYGNNDDHEDLMLCSHQLKFISPADGETKKITLECK